MPNSMLGIMVALTLGGLPAFAHSPSLEEMKASFEGSWTLGPSQADNMWRCEESPMRVTLSFEFKQNRTVATVQNWPASGSETVFNVMPVISLMKLGDPPREEHSLTVALTPDRKRRPRITPESRYLRKMSDDVFVWGLMTSSNDRPVVFIRCSGDQ